LPEEEFKLATLLLNTSQHLATLSE